MSLIKLDKGRSPAAFRDKLTCPHIIFVGDRAIECGSERWKFIEGIGRYRIRYRCKSCGKTIQYDFSNNLSHPFEAFGKSRWRRFIDAAAQRKKQGMHPKIK